MLALEQLTLNGAVTLLTYLQYARLEDGATGAIAIAANLCEILSQLEAVYPGITTPYGWQQVHANAQSNSVQLNNVIESTSADYLFLENDRCGGFQSTGLS